MDWMELLNQFLAIILPTAATAVCAAAAWIGTQIKAKYTEKVNTQLKKDIVNSTVTYIQQVYEALDGTEKLKKAITQASLIFQEKGIKISEVELSMLIESAVYGLKQGLTSSKQETLPDRNS